MKKSTADLTKLSDFSKEACAYRLRLAIEYAQISKVDLASKSNVGKSAITHMVQAKQFPSRSVEDWFYQNHGIDFNFFRAGDVRALSSDVREKLVQIAAMRAESSTDN